MTASPLPFCRLLMVLRQSAPKTTSQFDRQFKSSTVERYSDSE
jgi:hypothetical protein